MFKVVRQFLTRKSPLFMIEFMLGVSNVILEEDRMVNNTRTTKEQQEIEPNYY